MYAQYATLVGRGGPRPGCYRARANHQGYDQDMPDDAAPPARTRGERAGAILLVLLALGLLYIGTDIITGGRLTGRGCGCNDDAGAGD
jgi:hypothetical protein